MRLFPASLLLLSLTGAAAADETFTATLGALKTDLSNTTPKPGYDLTLALLVLDAGDKGTGEFTPAAKSKLRHDAALATEDSTTETIWLKGVAKK